MEMHIWTYILPAGSSGDGTGATIHLTEGNRNYGLVNDIVN
jgi:hypothetical protein